MRSKFLILTLIATSLICYLEWGAGNKSFLFEIEYEVFKQIFTAQKLFVHPLILLPLLGQILLLITLFQKKPQKILIYISIVCLGLLLILIFFIGILAMNYKILISVLPFLITAIITILSLKQSKSDKFL
ncbi:MAG: hypothetical protein LBQ60_19675 [Bacteroidales bacterium]|jgi:peptidoglycan/LPS O-acetylase OafA/YrhL|nr:hypothetical protein [Bacteroidales bacterium]